MIKLIFVISLLTLLASCTKDGEVNENENLELSKAMSSLDNSEFERALETREFKFPEDHGAHPGFRTEWWYFTGNLASMDNRKFGYQFTIFRTALTGQKPVRKSGWNTNQIYMGHFALTDINNERFYFDEQFSRDGNELAGAEAEPFRVWLEDWVIAGINDTSAYDLPIINLRASQEYASINFTLKAAKPIILQGEQGLSQKGKEPGNASYYYSYTRLETDGRISINDDDYIVTGTSWMDREWSTSALDSSQAGWDWFSLQFNDNSELMYYQLRRKDDTPDIFSKGVLVDENGNSEIIDINNVTLVITDYWESPEGSVYPSGWKLQIPDKDLNLLISPRVKNQLMDVTVTYWEGSVNISGTKNGRDIGGYGYVELTGY
jgi:predicted secreted hydrolase